MDETAFVKAFENINSENVFNHEDGSLPYGYFNPDTDGKLIWICNYDHEGKITSVFAYEDDKQVSYLDNIEQAQHTRDELVRNGWKKLIPPKVTFTYPGQKEGTPLNRKQRRYLKKKIRLMNKKNPFKSDDPEDTSLEVEKDS